MPRHPPPPTRRACLGPARPFDEDRAGRIVTVSGTVAGTSDAPDGLVAASAVALSGLLSCERCPHPIHLRLEGVELLVEGTVAVVVGSHELEVRADGYGWLSLRQLEGGCRVRARGRLRRITAPRAVGYRGVADVWALCATGTTDTVDIACEDEPRRGRREGQLVGDTRPAGLLAAGIHGRRGRRP